MGAVSTLVLANMLWVLFSLPGITLFAATAALFSVVLKQVRGEDPNFALDFWAAFRGQWLKATVAGSLAALVLVLLYIDGVFLFLLGWTWILALGWLYLFFVAAALMAHCFLWPLLAAFPHWPLRRLLRTAGVLALAHPLRALGLAGLGAAAVVLTLYVPVLLFLITPAALAWAWCRTVWRTAERYLVEES